MDNFVVIVFCNYLSYVFKGVKTNGLFFCSKYIYYAFVIQSIIIVIAMISPSFLEVVQIFQMSGDAERAEKYLGVRGLALASAQFFPLSSAFAVGQLFSIYYLF